MPSYTEARHTGEHVISEANGARSREQGTLAAGNLAVGTVLALDINGDYVQLAPAATDSTATAVAVLYAAVDASAAPAPCVVHARDCEVASDEVVWPDAATAAQITTGTNDLASAGIILR